MLLQKLLYSTLLAACLIFPQVLPAQGYSEVSDCLTSATLYSDSTEFINEGGCYHELKDFLDNFYELDHIKPNQNDYEIITRIALLEHWRGPVQYEDSFEGVAPVARLGLSEAARRLLLESEGGVQKVLELLGSQEEKTRFFAAETIVLYHRWDAPSRIVTENTLEHAHTLVLGNLDCELDDHALRVLNHSWYVDSLIPEFVDKLEPLLHCEDIAVEGLARRRLFYLSIVAPTPSKERIEQLLSETKLTQNPSPRF